MEGRKLKLGFKDDFNKAKTLSVDYPKANLEKEELIRAMDQIISSEVLKTKDGKVSKKNKAYLENTSIEDFKINE